LKTIKTQSKATITISAAWVVSMTTVIGIYLVAIAPAQEIAAKTHTNFLEQTSKINRGAKLLSEHSLQSSTEKLQLVSDTFGQYVTNYESAYNFALEVSQIAKKVGMLNLQTKGSDSEMLTAIINCPNIRSSKIHIEGTGSYRQVTNLINALESHQPLILIHSFSISANKKSSETMDVKMELRLIVEGKELYENRKKLELILSNDNQTGGDK
jgi:hypothetical protein